MKFTSNKIIQKYATWDVEFSLFLCPFSLSFILPQIAFFPTMTFCFSASLNVQNLFSDIFVWISKLYATLKGTHASFEYTALHAYHSEHLLGITSFGLFLLVKQSMNNLLWHLPQFPLLSNLVTHLTQKNFKQILLQVQSHTIT